MRMDSRRLDEAFSAAHATGGEILYPVAFEYSTMPWKVDSMPDIKEGGKKKRRKKRKRKKEGVCYVDGYRQASL
jgi:hypothetical protein